MAPAQIAWFYHPDEHVLYVTNAGLNSVAVIQGVPLQPKVIGLVPTGFYPHSISVSGDGQRLYILHGKSRTGPNGGKKVDQRHYVEELLKSSLLTMNVRVAGLSKINLNWVVSG